MNATRRQLLALAGGVAALAGVSAVRAAATPLVLGPVGTPLPVPAPPVPASAALRGAIHDEPPPAPLGSARRLWLTLDDGPHPTHTDIVLAALASHRVRATFFVIGSNAAVYRNVLRRIHDAGHRIGNHTFSHPHLTELSEDRIYEEIARTKDVIEPYEGSDPIYRPPYGNYNGVVDAIARSLGYRTVFWNVDTLDWNTAYQPDAWVQHGISQIGTLGAARVLAHDIHRTTALNYDGFMRRIEGMGPVRFEAPETL